MTEQEKKPKRGLLADRQRQKELHLQGDFDLSKTEKKNESKTIRASEHAASIIEDLFYTRRYKSKQEALDEIIRVYLLHQNDNKND